MRRYRPDLGIIISETNATAAGVFTRNEVKAAPVLYSQNLLPSAYVRAIITNSGQANAATGPYVALGDSYASGEGLSPYEPGTDVVAGAERNQCHRSDAQAYADLSPPLVLPGVTDRAFWACSGATVGDMEQVPPQSGPDEQFNQVD